MAKEYSPWYEEYTIIPQFWGWLILIGISTATLGWMMLLMVIIPDTPREWDFGALPDVPAQSIYSTLEPPPGMEPVQQLPTLPEAKPLEPPPPPQRVPPDAPPEAEK